VLRLSNPPPSSRKTCGALRRPTTQGERNVIVQHDSLETRRRQRDRCVHANPATHAPIVCEPAADLRAVACAGSDRRYRRTTGATCGGESPEAQLADFHRGLAEAARYGQQRRGAQSPRHGAWLPGGAHGRLGENEYLAAQDRVGAFGRERRQGSSGTPPLIEHRSTDMQITEMLGQMGGLRSMANELGVNETEVASGAEALAPAILGGFKKQVQSQPSGLQGLGGLLGKLGGGGLLDDVLSPHPTNVNRGNDVLGKIFGSKDVSRAVARNAASKTGLSPDLLKRMLPMMAML